MGRKTKWELLHEEPLTKMYIKQKLSCKEIGKIVNCSWHTVLVALRANDISVRPKGGKKGLPLPLEIKKKISLALTGPKNPNWKGGVKSLYDKIRSLPEYAEWRHKIYVRDNYTCVECQEVGKSLNAHHLKSLSDIVKEYSIKDLSDAKKCDALWDINNGVTLCEECHKLTDNYGNNSRK